MKDHIHTYSCLLMSDGKVVWPPRWGCLVNAPLVDLVKVEADYSEAMQKFNTAVDADIARLIKEDVQ